ncbi:hypothetical protein ACQ4PT_023684 [Festuca glaucescens]
MRLSSMATAMLFIATVVLLLAVQDGHCAQLCMDSSMPSTSFIFCLSFLLTVCDFDHVDQRSRGAVNGSLSFCGYNGTACCNATEDATVEKQFAAMNISGTPCGDLVKPILCARCNPYAGELFTVEATPRTVPLLCNSTGVASRVSGVAAATGYCAEVWDTCKDVSIRNRRSSRPRAAHRRRSSPRCGSRRATSAARWAASPSASTARPRRSTRPASCRP